MAPESTTKSREELHRDEVEFFAHYYGAQQYNATGWRLRLQRELRSLLKRAGGARLGRVLSLGCGDGQFELMLAPYCESIVGLDLSPEGITIAKRSAEAAGVRNVAFDCRPLESLAWSDSYDAIICLAMVHHIPPAEVQGMLRQVYEHLLPGGLFYSQDPNRRGLLRAVGRLVLGHSYNTYHTPDERELDPDELAAELKAAGFRDIRCGYIDLTLIPGLYVLAKGPSWPMYPMLWADWLWCHSPLSRWSSGFNMSARR
jgi:2-polyprenyl-3-methyl-5-hydroxy-6-metoxy-1,4-benzoquinol methylase